MFVLLVVAVSAVQGAEAEEIVRRLPPPGIEIPQAERAKLRDQLGQLQGRLKLADASLLKPDAEVLLKAVDYALLHGEFYNAKDTSKAQRLLKLADERLQKLAAGESPWLRQRGRVVRGYYSSIDGSPQPYGLEIPEDYDFSKPAPLYVWLHGRGDKTTDLHFIDRLLARKGQIATPGAMVLHPFGRQCVGFKWAGEIDVLEAIEHVKSQYKIDSDRIVLMGFSMGGAGCWHIGAHYTDRWVAMSPGAGFAETARYNNLKTENYPPKYEQALWGVYDVPGYTRNLFNLPVVVYSGEKDKQIQAARVMEEAYLSHDRKLPHIIGPGMGHRYHPDSLKQVLQRMRQAARKGLDRSPKRVSLQTQTLRYSRVHWVQATGLGAHWQDSRIDAEITGEKKITVRTKNITSFVLDPWPNMTGTEITIDSQIVKITSKANKVEAAVLELKDGQWRQGLGGQTRFSSSLNKSPGLQGPIDDAFISPFLVVTPSGTAQHEQVQQWVESELAHFQVRWRALMRGQVRIKQDKDVTSEDIENYNLILWGDPKSNQLIAKVLDQLPLTWTDKSVKIGKQQFDAATHLPALVYPNPLAPNRYIVINSGHTFREGHDRTNSLQNAKLPDWSIIDLSTPPSDLSPGKIVAAAFFDEQWRVKKE